MPERGKEDKTWGGMTDIGKEEKIRVYRNLGGGVRQNLIWGIGTVNAKQCRVGYARGGVKKNSRRGGVVEVKKYTGGVSDA